MLDIWKQHFTEDVNYDTYVNYLYIMYVNNENHKILLNKKSPNQLFQKQPNKILSPKFEIFLKIKKKC